MIRSYRTDYANEAHQVVVSVSKHFFIKKDGGLGWQKKPFEVQLANAANQKRRHVVHYLIRDHYSGAFYAEVHPADDMPDVAEFLCRAWMPKDDHPFCGVPSAATIAATVLQLYPNLVGLLDAYGIQFVKATSGFQSGVRDLRTWEDNIRWWPAYSEFGDVQVDAPRLSRILCEDNGDKFQKWRKGLRQILVPESAEDFLRTYARAAETV